MCDGRQLWTGDPAGEGCRCVVCGHLIGNTQGLPNPSDYTWRCFVCANEIEREAWGEGNAVHWEGEDDRYEPK